MANGEYENPYRDKIKKDEGSSKISKKFGIGRHLAPRAVFCSHRGSCGRNHL